MAEQTKKKFKFRFPLWAKTLLVLLFSVSLISIVGINFFSSTIRSITRNFYIDQSVETASTLAIFLDLNNVKAVKNKTDEIYQSIPEKDKVENSYWGELEWEKYCARFNEVIAMPEYEAIMEQLALFHSKNTEAKYTCLVYADFVKERIIYLADDADEEERCTPGTFDNFTEHDRSIHDNPEGGFPPEITNMPEYGYLASTAQPIFDESHNIVAYALVDLSMDEIIARENANTQTLVITLTSISVGSVLIGFLLVVFFIARPVRILAKAANDYTSSENKELNKFEKIKINTRDEIEDLSNSMKKMEGDINHYITDLLSTTTALEGAEKKVDEMKHLADRDALTGVLNKRAYFEVEERLNEEIKNGDANFSIAMIDLNDLKVTNDTLGHERGDILIVAVSETINKIFTKSTVYRVGGDEFVVVSEDEDYRNIKKLESAFKSEMKKYDSQFSAAIGVVVYDPSIDNNVEDTFKRADSKMYRNKKEMKSL